MYSIGQKLRIRVGPLKGYLCRVIALCYSDVTVKLDSHHKIFTVKSEHLSEVRNRTTVLSTSGDAGTGSFQTFDMLGTEGSSGDWAIGAGTSGEGDKWNVGAPTTDLNSWGNQDSGEGGSTWGKQKGASCGGSSWGRQESDVGGSSLGKQNDAGGGSSSGNQNDAGGDDVGWEIPKKKRQPKIDLKPNDVRVFIDLDTVKLREPRSTVDIKTEIKKTVDHLLGKTCHITYIEAYTVSEMTELGQIGDMVQRQHIQVKKYFKRHLRCRPCKARIVRDPGEVNTKKDLLELEMISDIGIHAVGTGGTGMIISCDPFFATEVRDAFNTRGVRVISGLPDFLVENPMYTVR